MKKQLYKKKTFHMDFTLSLSSVEKYIMHPMHNILYPLLFTPIIHFLKLENIFQLYNCFILYISLFIS